MIILLDIIDSPLKVIINIMFKIQLLTADWLNSIIAFWGESPDTSYEFYYM